MEKSSIETTDKNLEGPAKREEAESRVEDYAARMNQAVSLDELQEAVREAGDITGSGEKVYDAETINRELERLSSFVKEFRIQKGHDWWDENLIEHIAREHGITNGTDENCFRVRDNMIRLLKPENAGWLFKQEALSEELKVLENKIKVARTFDKIIEELKKAQEEARKDGRDIKIPGSSGSKVYDVEPIVEIVDTVKKATNMEFARSLTRQITKTLGLNEAVNRILDVREMAEELPSIMS